MKAFPHPQNVVESLEAIIAQLQRLQLPAGDIGSSLLDILEILGGLRHTDYEYEGTGPPSELPPARVGSSGGRGSGSETGAASSQGCAVASANIRDWLGRHQPQEVSR